MDAAAMPVTLTEFSPKLRDIIPPRSQLETVASGFQKTEGPVWFAASQALLFTDFGAFKIFQWHAENGLSVFRENSNRAVGLARDADQRLIAAESMTRSVTRTEKNNAITTLASHWEGKRLNSPNDVVVHSTGDIFFTDPRSRFLTDTREIEFNGVYRVDPANGSVHLLTDTFQWPNGLCFSPDETRLYINDSSRQQITVFDMTDAGALKNGRVFCELEPRFGKGAPDGMKVDVLGHLYVTGPGGVWIFDANGERLGILQTPKGVLNLGFAETTLFLTAQSTLFRIALVIPGI
jgi:sugar lactone lactonase YvrE